MKNILILGAGLSSSAMISYLLEQAAKHEWNVAVGDVSLETAQMKVAGNPRGRAFKFDVADLAQLKSEMGKCDLVVSMLPARFHPVVAEEAVAQSKFFACASYISPEMKSMEPEIKAKGLLFLNEMGVDPGIDHMSAMKVIHEIQAKGGKITEFRSYCGGLVAPEYDNNPWNYKFTWNPRNVVLAGNGVSRFIEKDQYKYIPYHKLYSRYFITSVPGLGDFEVYPNRDSLKYRESYGLQDVQTMIRGTMRRPGYCKAWDVFVQLGMTDDTYMLENVDKMTWRMFINTFLPYDPKLSVEEKVCKTIGITMDSEPMSRLKWLGIFENTLVGMKEGTPAQLLQKILEEKWGLEPQDKDLLVMQHHFTYVLNGTEKHKRSTLVAIGKDQVNTAMAITVGTPLAIGIKMAMLGEIKLRGVFMPVIPELYKPILKELEDYDVKFIEEDLD